MISTSPVCLTSEELLKEGMTFAFGGFHAWRREDATINTTSVEELILASSNQ